jgi:hypothetical protein
MDVRLPDGTVIRGVPDGMSRADLTAKLAKNGYDVSKLGAPPKPIAQNFEDVHETFRPTAIANKKAVDDWRAAGSPTLSTAPKNEAEFNQVRAVLAGLNYEKEHGRPAPEIPKPVQRKATQHDIDNAARLGRDPNIGPNGKPDGFVDKVLGSTVEPVATVGTGILGGLVGNLAGMGDNILSGTYGTPEGIDAGHKTAQRVAQSMTFQPRTATGNKVMGAIGSGIEQSGIAGVPITGQLASLAGPAVRQIGRTAAVTNAGINAADDALRAQPAGKLSDLVRGPKPAGMAGVGAAETAEATLRAQRFANMRAPMQPTKGILSRNIDDVQFEREAAKRPEGKALDQRYADLNRGMEQHMDALVDQTGATASSARQTGKAVTAAMEAKKAAKKAEIKQAYKEAKEAGDMAEMVDIKPLANWLDENRSAASTATIVKSIESEIDRLSGGTGKLSINDMEQLRKLTGSLAEKGTPNGTYGTAAIKLIDETTAGKGGPKYQQARRQFENYANEFKNRDAVAKLLRTKRGTKDRAVAYEDVADSILFEGSLDDMKHAFRVLEAHPKGTAPEIIAAGQQAARELRGAAAAKLKERMFSNAGADSSGRVVGSEAQINRIVRELDKDGKLEALFGKKGAEEIRDTALVAKDLYSTPKGTVNSSNTASAMEKVLDRMAGTFGGTPVVGHAIKYGAKKLESRNYAKRVSKALEPTPPPPPRTLGDMAGDRP